MAWISSLFSWRTSYPSMFSPAGCWPGSSWHCRSCFPLQSLESCNFPVTQTCVQGGQRGQVLSLHKAQSSLRSQQAWIPWKKGRTNVLSTVCPKQSLRAAPLLSSPPFSLLFLSSFSVFKVIHLDYKFQVLIESSIWISCLQRSRMCLVLCSWKYCS